MLIITLDTNCLYAVENGTATPSLLELVERGRRGLIKIHIPAISASERQRGGLLLNDFRDFADRLDRCGLGFAQTVEPMAYINLAFIEHCVLIGPENEALERKIHEILFPEISFQASNHCPASDSRGIERWRNVKCDVQAMWCHINYGGDIFVTLDRNFFKSTKRCRLERLGAKLIARPEQAIAEIDK